MFASSLSSSRVHLQRMPFSVLIRKGTDKMFSVPKTEVVAKKSNLKQSPLKMKFLVMLIRDRWVPDALAQMKFSPKHRAADVAQIINRACAIHKLNHGTIPEELKIQEVMITKGHAQKKLRIMGKGMAGFGYTREAHITIKVDKIDFERQIAEASSITQKKTWIDRYNMVKAIKDAGAVGSTNFAPAVASS